MATLGSGGQCHRAGPHPLGLATALLAVCRPRQATRRAAPRRRRESGLRRAPLRSMRLMGGIIGHVGSSAPYRSHTLRLFAVFGGYHGLGRSAGEGVERQAPQPGEDRGGEVPHAANPPAALLTGGVSGLALPRRADGVPGGPPLACARPWRSTRAAADGDSPLHPVVPARDPPCRSLGWPPLDVRECARHRDNAAALLVWGCGGTAGGPDMATRRKALVDGEGDDEGSASGAEPGADDCALQRESGWHAGGEVLGTSNPGDCPYDPDDCPSIEVVESETGWRRRPCVRRNPRTACPRAVSRTTACVPRRRRVSVTLQSQSALFRHVAAPGRCGATPRQAAGHYGECLNWANVLEQPPAKLRGGLRGGPQISAWRRTSRKGALCTPDLTENRTLRSRLTERRSVRGCPHTECAFW